MNAIHWVAAPIVLGGAALLLIAIYSGRVDDAAEALRTKVADRSK